MAKNGKRTTKLPKRIGGVKIPKDLRRSGERLIDTVVEQANTPKGREVAAGMMGMAAAAMGAIAAKNAERARRDAASRTPSVPPVPPVPPQPPQGGTTREPDFQAIAETIGRNVEAAVERMFGAKKI